jgi:hypothetical protein
MGAMTLMGVPGGEISATWLGASLQPGGRLPFTRGKLLKIV